MGGVIDRTSDFHSILRDLAVQRQIPTANLAVAKGQSELNIAAGELGEDIHKARLRVEELRKLSKKHNIFDDKTHAVQVISSGIQQDVQRLNAKYELLEQKVNAMVSNSANQLHARTMLSTLKTRISDIIKDVKEALETRTNTMVKQNDRRSLYKKSFAMRGWSDPVNGEGRHREGGIALEAQDVCQMNVNSRAEAITSIQQKIGAIASMSQKMTVEVAQQEEAFQRLDADLEDAISNMDDGQEQLLRYFHNISGNRCLILKVFAILIFFVVFFVVFLAN